MAQNHDVLKNGDKDEAGASDEDLQNLALFISSTFTVLTESIT